MSRLVVLLGLVLVTLPMMFPLAIASATCESDGLKYNCVTETVRTREYGVTYSNGLNGTANATALSGEAIYAQWPSHIDGNQLADGVLLAPSFESPARVWPANNTLGHPDSTNRPYYFTTSQRKAYDLPYGNLTTAYAYKIRFNASDIMNGASEFYYRSALMWNNPNLTALYVNIKDQGGEVIAAGSYDQLVAPNLRPNSSAVHDERVYFRFVSPILAGQTYTVTEYVRVVQEESLTHLDLYLAPDQDLAGDEHSGLIAFPSQAGATFVQTDPGASFRFVVGMGTGGTLNLITGNATHSAVKIYASQVRSLNQTLDPELVRVFIPLRTTVPLSGTLYVRPIGGTGDAQYAKPFEDVIGSINEMVDISAWVPATATHNFEVQLEFDLPSSTECGLAECNYVTIAAYPDVVSGHASHYVIERQNALMQTGNMQGVDFQLWVEIYEEDATVIYAASASERGWFENTLERVKNVLVGLFHLAKSLVLAPAKILLRAFQTGDFLGAVNQTVDDFVIGIAHIRAGVYNTAVDVQHTRADLERLGRGIAGIGAVAACAGSWIAPHPVAKIALGAACALLGVSAFGGLPGLLEFVVRIPEIVMAAVEQVGEFLARILDVALPIFVIVGTFLGVILTIYAFIVPSKYLVLMLLAPIGAMMGYRRATDWHIFDRVYNLYLPIWSDFVERRIFKMEVYA